MNKFLLISLLSLLVLFACNSAETEKKAEKDTYYIGQIKTSFGDMYFSMYEETPNHNASFIKLANEGYWDDYTFNRVIKDFVIQGGCPDTPEGFKDSPYLINPEFDPKIKHIYGAVGMGRDDNTAKQSAGCQLYIVNNQKGAPQLNWEYMIFGQMFEGFEVLEAISNVETDSLDNPLENIPMEVHALKFTKKEMIEKGMLPKE